jgi:hypothetical protein
LLDKLHQINERAYYTFLKNDIMFFPCLGAAALPGFLLPAAVLLEAFVLSVLAAGCGLLGRVGLPQNGQGQKSVDFSVR